MPFGAWILWPLMVIMSAPSVLAENGTFRNPCTASVCSRAMLFSALSIRATAAMSLTAPVSLLTIMSETRIVSGRSAARTRSSGMAPVPSGCRRVIS